MTLEVAYVKRWSLHADDYKVYFSVFTVDDGAAGAARQDAIERVNAMFANPSGTDIVPLEIRGLAEDFSIPASYDPHSLPTFSYVGFVCVSVVDLVDILDPRPWILFGSTCLLIQITYHRTHHSQIKNPTNRSMEKERNMRIMRSLVMVGGILAVQLPREITQCSQVSC